MQYAIQLPKDVCPYLLSEEKPFHFVLYQARLVREKLNVILTLFKVVHVRLHKL